jgi:hypothetical protein
VTTETVTLLDFNLHALLASLEDCAWYRFDIPIAATSLSQPGHRLAWQ